MAKFCKNCGRKQSFRDRFIYSDKLCNECAIALDNKRAPFNKLRSDENKRAGEHSLTLPRSSEISASDAGRNAASNTLTNVQIANVWLDNSYSFFPPNGWRNDDSKRFKQTAPILPLHVFSPILCQMRVFLKPLLKNRSWPYKSRIMSSHLFHVS